MAELNDDQTREVNRCDTLIQFLDTTPNPPIWTPYVPFKKEVNLLRGNVDALNLLVPKKEASGKLETLSKEELKKLFAETVGGMFNIASVYANNEGNTTLAGQVTKSATAIDRMKDTEIIGFAKSLSTDIFTNALLADVVFETYGITDQMVTDAIDIATKFNSKIGLSASITVISETANSDINKLVDAMRVNVGKLLNLSPYFKNDNSSFVTGLEKAAKLDHIGVRHTGIVASITVDGLPAEGGEVIIGKKKAVSNSQGNCKPMYVRPGDKLITVNYPGKLSKSITYHFIRGQVDNKKFDF